MQDLIQRLLMPDSGRRLGSAAGGARDIKRHAFFRGFDWDALLRRAPLSMLLPYLLPFTDVPECSSLEATLLAIAKNL